ncbi:MAG: hypothetical protein ABL958_03770, partial [Bdellovibrionia bacterium]
MFIKDSGLNCGVQSTSIEALIDFKVTVRYQSRPSRPTLDECSSEITLSNPNDSRAPKLTIQAVRNIAGDPIPPGACTDRRSVQQVAGAGGPGTDWQTILIDMLSDEPGSILTCRKAGLFEADPADRFWNCPDLPLLAGNFSMTPSENTITYNRPIQARITMADMPDRGQDMHIYQIKSTDVGGNESVLTNTSFRVHAPTCPVTRDQYCPNAVPASPPSPLFQGIMVRPYDDCTNGVCWNGTHSDCSGAGVGGACQGTFLADDCGNLVCEGTQAPSCAGTVPALVPCNQPVIGSCGAACGLGTFGCSAPPTPPATPAPACDCSGVDLAALACNTFAPDSCGTVDACGPGTLACPTPAPTWSWGPGTFQVDESSSRTTTRTYTFPAGVIPPGYANYAVDVDVWGTSDRAASRITVSATITSPGGSNTFSRSGGPYY